MKKAGGVKAIGNFYEKINRYHRQKQFVPFQKL